MRMCNPRALPERQFALGLEPKLAAGRIDIVAFFAAKCGADVVLLKGAQKPLLHVF